MNDATPPNVPRKSLVSRLLPNPRLIGGIALGAAALGIYLGTKIPGLGLGRGGGDGIGLGKNSTDDVVISTGDDNGRAARKKDESKKDDKAADRATRPTTAAALDVVIDGDGYALRQGSGKNDYAPVSLDEIVRLVRDFPADKEGVRIRVFRRGSALPTAERRIQEALAQAGVPEKEILMVKDLVD